MGIEDPTVTASYESSDRERPARPALPTWADESTVAVPLAELFPDDGDE